MLDLVTRLGPERLAMPTETRQALAAAPMLALLDETALKIELDQIAREIDQEQLLWRRWHQEGSRYFQLEFDSFKFVAAPPSSGLARIKQQMREDVLRRFRNKSFDSLIFIQRGNDNYRMGPFFEELLALLHCSTLIGFLTSAEKRKDGIWMTDFALSCGGKSVLLVDPIMGDSSLDDAYDVITEYQGRVDAVLILFEVKGIPPSNLRHYISLKDKSGSEQLQGQVVLDLQEIHPLSSH